jgi:hypothetical protein
MHTLLPQVWFPGISHQQAPIQTLHVPLTSQQSPPCYYSTASHEEYFVVYVDILMKESLCPSYHESGKTIYSITSMDNLFFSIDETDKSELDLDHTVNQELY